MARPRSSHQEKTYYEKREYFQNTIRGVSPTLDSPQLLSDSTDVPAVSEPEEVGPLTPTRPKSETWESIKENWLKVVLIPILLAIIYWAASLLVSVNREMGELSTKTSHIEKQQDMLAKELDKTEGRLLSTIEKNTRWLERIEERLYSPNTTPLKRTPCVKTLTPPKKP